MVTAGIIAPYPTVSQLLKTSSTVCEQAVCFFSQSLSKYLNFWLHMATDYVHPHTHVGYERAQ